MSYVVHFFAIVCLNLRAQSGMINAAETNAQQPLEVAIIEQNKIGNGSGKNAVYAELVEDMILRDYLAIDRTKLANERTLLAFIRTFIGLLASGLGMVKLFEFDVTTVIGYGLAGAGVVFLVVGVVLYIKRGSQLRRMEKAANENGQQPPAQAPQG